MASPLVVDPGRAARRAPTRQESPVLCYGVCAGPSDKAERIALPGIRASDPSGYVLVRRGERSIFTAYNSMLDEAAALGAEALVLVHDDVQLRDPRLPTTLSEVFADGSVGLVGVIGGTGVRDLRWWEHASVGYAEEVGRTLDYGRGQHEAEVVDGIFLALPRRAFGLVRFDEGTFTGFHGYDADISCQVAARGLRVVTADVDLLHHTKPTAIKGPNAHRLANLLWLAKWHPPATAAGRRLLRARTALARRAATLPALERVPGRLVDPVLWSSSRRRRHP